MGYQSPSNSPFTLHGATLTAGFAAHSFNLGRPGFGSEAQLAVNRDEPHRSAYAITWFTVGFEVHVLLFGKCGQLVHALSLHGGSGLVWVFFCQTQDVLDETGFTVGIGFAVVAI